MGQPESIGSILERVFPSLMREAKKRRAMSADTVELRRCRCCGELFESELGLDECPSCRNRLVS